MTPPGSGFFVGTFMFFLSERQTLTSCIAITPLLLATDRGACYHADRVWQTERVGLLPWQLSKGGSDGRVKLWSQDSPSQTNKQTTPPPPPPPHFAECVFVYWEYTVVLQWLVLLQECKYRLNTLDRGWWECHCSWIYLCCFSHWVLLETNCCMEDY